MSCDSHMTQGVPYLSDIGGGDGEEVDLVCQPLGRLDRGDVGIDQNCLHPLLSQCLDRLGNQEGELIN